MPEGDSLHRVAARLQVLVGQRVEASSPNPRGVATGVARAVDGRVLESVEAVGKHLLLRFEGGVTVRSHLRMNGRWRVRAPERARRGSGAPWLVLSTAALRGDAMERARAHARRRPRRAARPRPARRDDVRVDGRRSRLVRPTRAVCSATSSSTSASSRASGTCGWRSCSGRLGSRRGCRSARRRTRSSRRRSAWARAAMLASVAGTRSPQRRLPPGGTAVPAVRRADPVPRARRREPHRLLVRGVPARSLSARPGQGSAASAE